MVPLEFFVLRNESPEHHFVPTLEAFVFHHFLWIFSLHQGNISIDAFTIGWSEKQKSWKMQKARADSKSRHTTDFRTVFEIMIGRFVSCEIGQTYFTESGVRFGTLERPDFRSFS